MQRRLRLDHNQEIFLIKKPCKCAKLTTDFQGPKKRTLTY